jgi:hypothetical protein
MGHVREKGIPPQQRGGAVRSAGGHCSYRYPIVSTSDARGAGTLIETNDLARGSVENLGNPMACAIRPLASSSE